MHFRQYAIVLIVEDVDHEHGYRIVFEPGVPAAQ